MQKRTTELRSALLACVAWMCFALLPSSVVAQVTKQTFTTTLSVYNPNDVSATMLMRFYRQDGSYISWNAGIGPNTLATYVTLPSVVGNGFKGSLSVSSALPLFVSSNFVSPSLSISFGGAAFAATTQGARSLYLPIIFKQLYNYTTFFSVQNLDASATNLTVTYSGTSNGNYINTTQFFSLGPWATITVDQSDVAALPVNFYGSATISSTGSNIAATVVEVAPNRVLSYNALIPIKADTKPVFPLVVTNNQNYITGISVQNIGSSATTVTVSFMATTNGTSCTETITLAANTQVSFAVDAFKVGGRGSAPGSDNCGDGQLFVGSARVTSNSTNQPLVAIVNQTNNVTNKGGAYTAFSSNEGSRTVIFPLIEDRVSGYNSGIGIMNLGANTITVTCAFSNSSYTVTNVLGPNQSFTKDLASQIAPGYVGSVRCTANQNNARIVGTTNLLRASGTADTFFVTEGLNL